MAFGYSLWYIHGTPTFYVGDDKSATQNECVAFSSDFRCPSAPRFYGILKSLNPTSLSDSPKIILYSPIKHKTILAGHRRHIIQIGHLLHCTHAHATPRHHTPTKQTRNKKKGRETAQPPSPSHVITAPNTTPYHKKSKPDNRPISRTKTTQSDTETHCFAQINTHAPAIPRHHTPTKQIRNKKGARNGQPTIAHPT